MKIPIFLLWCTLAAHAETLMQADMGKLLDPLQRETEISRLAISGDSFTLVRYHLLDSPQRGNTPPLHTLAAQREFTGSHPSPNQYRINHPDELFGLLKVSFRARTEPSLDPVCDSVLLVFDPNGTEIRPFGGNNFIKFGYLFDFDGDGILDRADSINYGLNNAEDYKVQVFHLESVEPEPRSLLRVLFNFHPRGADEANDWMFECFDENNDGLPEIGFGPQGALREIVFRFDTASGSYTAGELPEDAHVRVLAADDDLASIARAGGLGYSLITKSAAAAEKSTDPLPSPEDGRSYVHRPFGDLPLAALAAFFQGNSRRDWSDGAVGAFPNRLPENLTDLSPKEAALALAEVNRTPSHRAAYQLAIDDRNGIAPPESGWIQYSWQSSSCYTSSTASYAIRFGMPDPVLIVQDDNRIGFVGRNPWADQPAHDARLVSLSEKEARFLTDTLFWLDRIRSRPLTGTSADHMSMISTADGRASINLFPDDAEPRLLVSGWAWAITSISGAWVADYDPATCVNLAGLLLKTSLPGILGDRWQNTRAIDRHSIATPTEVRLQRRVSDSERERLAVVFADILEINARTPIPPFILSPLCKAAGAEALVTLLPSLETLNLQPDQVPREALTDAINRLRLAADPDRLKQVIKDRSPDKSWALAQLRRTDPEAWGVLLAADFHTSAPEERLAILATLAVGHPPAAAALIGKLSPAQRSALIFVIARLHQKHDPQSLASDIPAIMRIVRNKREDTYRRIEAMEFLSRINLAPAQLAAFRALLVEEIRNPANANWHADSRTAALDAITNLPNPSQHLALIVDTPGIGKSSFASGFRALLVMSADHPSRDRILCDFLRPQFMDGRGFMNGIFIEALAHDLRSLAPDIAAMSSASPDIADGDGADSFGGDFKSPAGHRYHMAREITALWVEKEPATLAKMWIAFASARSSHFEGEDSVPLRRLAEKHIMALPPAERKAAIAQISRLIPIPAHHSATTAWLASLAP